MTQWYSERADDFTSQIRAAYKDIFSLIDTDTDGYITRHEMGLAYKSCGHVRRGILLKYFKNVMMQPKIKVIDFVDAYQQFLMKKERNWDSDKIHALWEIFKLILLFGLKLNFVCMDTTLVYLNVKWFGHLCLQRILNFKINNKLRTWFTFVFYFTK